MSTPLFFESIGNFIARRSHSFTIVIHSRSILLQGFWKLQVLGINGVVANLPTTLKNKTKLQRKPPSEKTKKAGQMSLDSGVEGMIYPHCLQRIRHLKLVTSRSAMIGWDAGSIDDPYVTQTGELILEILRSLSEESAPMAARTQRLRLTIMSNWELEGVKKGDYAAQQGYLDAGPAIEFGKPLLAGVRVENMREEVRKMIVLLRRIQTSRIVRVEESVVRSIYDLRPTNQEINLGHFRHLGI